MGQGVAGGSDEDKISAYVVESRAFLSCLSNRPSCGAGQGDLCALQVPGVESRVGTVALQKGTGSQSGPQAQQAARSPAQRGCVVGYIPPPARRPLRGVGFWALPQGPAVPAPPAPRGAHYRGFTKASRIARCCSCVTGDSVALDQPSTLLCLVSSPLLGQEVVRRAWQMPPFTHAKARGWAHAAPPGRVEKGTEKTVGQALPGARQPMRRCVSRAVNLRNKLEETGKFQGGD